MRELPHHGRGQHRKARDAGENEDAARARLGVELRDAADEIGAVGEVEIVNAERERGAHHAIGIGAVELERAGGIDHDVRRELAQLPLDVAVAIEGRRHRRGWQIGAEALCFCMRAAGDDQRQPILVGEQLRQPSAEGAVAPEDQNLEGRHPGNRDRRLSITPPAPPRPSA